MDTYLQDKYRPASTDTNLVQKLCRPKIVDVQFANQQQKSHPGRVNPSKLEMEFSEKENSNTEIWQPQRKETNLLQT